jgi:hypothetical protein
MRKLKWEGQNVKRRKNQEMDDCKVSFEKKKMSG